MVELIGFDPIPIDIFYSLFDVFDFKWTSMKSDRENLEPIGFSDRVFLLSLGSLFLFMVYYVVSQTIAFCLWWCKSHYKVRKAFNYLYIETPTREILVLFFLEIYTELMIAGLLNHENAYLMNVWSNWGIGGNLSFSD